MSRKKKAAPSDAPRMEAFFAKHVRHVKGPYAGQPVYWEDWNREDWTLALELDPKTGLRVFRDVIFSRPKKSSKSLDAAGCGLFMLSPFEGEIGLEGYSAAGTRDQARMVLAPAQQMLNSNSIAYSPGLADLGFKKFRNTITNTRTEASWAVIPHDADTIEGVNPTFVSVDEYAVHTTPTLRDNLSTAMVMRDQPFMLTISTKGDRATGPFYELEKKAKKLPDFRQVSPYKWIAQDRDAGFLFINYGLDEDSDADIADPKVWKGINVASWVTVDALGRIFNSPSTSEVAFRRKHLNQWTSSSEESGIPAPLWDSCAKEGYQLPAGTTVCIGIDIGFTDDWSAVVAAGWDGDKIGLDAILFEPPSEKGMELDTAATVGEAIVDMLARYRVANIAIDKYQVKMLMQALGRAGLPVEGFPASPSHMGPASMELLNELQHHRIIHDGDPDLRTHVLNAVKRTVGLDGWMFAKPKTLEGAGSQVDRTAKIDGLVATLFAVSRLLARGRRKQTGRLSMIL